jgi:magnesium transporter
MRVIFMQICLWEQNRLKPLPLEDLKANFNRGVWIDITDPAIEDMQNVADSLNIPRHVLIGKLRSNYPHVDAYPEYVKVFVWHLVPFVEGKTSSFHRNPVIVLINKTSVITISHSRTNISERIPSGLAEKGLADFSLRARVIYLVMMHLLERYEHFTERFEGAAERLEAMIPPWPRDFYAEAFDMRKDASSFLRVLRHFRALVESLSKGRFSLSFTEEEMQLFDSVYDRAVGAEENTEMSLEIVKDLIEMHLDTVSHDMNRAMRLMAAITCIVVIPSVIANMLGMNLIDVPWPWQLWQVVSISVSGAALLAAYFYRKGWLTEA